MSNDREKMEGDYIYDVWRSGGNSDSVDREEIPSDYDWVWDEPTMPRRKEETP